MGSVMGRSLRGEQDGAGQPQRGGGGRGLAQGGGGGDGLQRQAKGGSGDGRGQGGRAPQVGAGRVAGAPSGDGELRQGRAQDAPGGGEAQKQGKARVGPEGLAPGQRDDGGRERGKGQREGQRARTCATSAARATSARAAPVTPRSRGAKSDPAARPAICAGSMASWKATP